MKEARGACLPSSSAADSRKMMRMWALMGALTAATVEAGFGQRCPTPTVTLVDGASVWSVSVDGGPTLCTWPALVPARSGATVGSLRVTPSLVSTCAMAWPCAPPPSLPPTPQLLARTACMRTMVVQSRAGVVGWRPLVSTPCARPHTCRLPVSSCSTLCVRACTHVCARLGSGCPAAGSPRLHPLCHGDGLGALRHHPHALGRGGWPTVGPTAAAAAAGASRARGPAPACSQRLSEPGPGRMPCARRGTVLCCPALVARP